MIIKSVCWSQIKPLLLDTAVIFWSSLSFFFFEVEEMLIPKSRKTSSVVIGQKNSKLFFCFSTKCWYSSTSAPLHKVMVKYLSFYLYNKVSLSVHFPWMRLLKKACQHAGCVPFPNASNQSCLYKPKFDLDCPDWWLSLTNDWAARLYSPASSSSMERWHLGSLAASFVCVESKLSFCECGVCVFRIVFNVCALCVWPWLYKQW